jgi:hypothetical protein
MEMLLANHPYDAHFVAQADLVWTVPSAIKVENVTFKKNHYGTKN